MIFTTSLIILLTICVIIAIIGIFILFIELYKQEQVVLIFTIFTIVISTFLLSYNYTMIGVYETLEDVNTSKQYQRWKLDQ